jgi:hypothetical protein
MNRRQRMGIMEMKQGKYHFRERSTLDAEVVVTPQRVIHRAGMGKANRTRGGSLQNMLPLE